jgi:hypothetical protein
MIVNFVLSLAALGASITAYRLVTSTILTRAAHDALGHIPRQDSRHHSKGPAGSDVEDVLSVGDENGYQQRGSAVVQVRCPSDLVPVPHLVPRIVGKELGSVRNNGPELIRPEAAA